LDPAFSRGLPPFLAPAAGTNSGFMLAQYTAASLVSENKVLAHPASVDTIPTSGKQEDHVSMGWTAVRKLREVVGNVRACLAVEICCATQGIDLRASVAEPSVPLRAVHALVRSKVAGWTSTARYPPSSPPSTTCSRRSAGSPRTPSLPSSDAPASRLLHPTHPWSRWAPGYVLAYPVRH
ncbi:MAG: aromatic amino acid lyase, partial [Streptosporangiaceae bacterium]